MGLHNPATPRLILDAETYGVLDLPKVGAQAYAEDPGTGVHVVSWWVKQGPDDGLRGRWMPGDPVPHALYRHVSRGGWWVAHNFLFELAILQHILGPRYGWPAPTLAQWSCTMARALYHGLPASLELLGEALELDNPKDKAARANMLKLAKPRFVDSDGTVHWWKDDPVKGPAMLADLYAYCDRDVDAEAEADAKLPELPDSEGSVFLMDARVNLRGIALDTDLVEALRRITVQEGQRLNAAMTKVTDGAVTATSQVANLTTWLGTQNVTTTGSLDKANVAALLDTTTGVAREALLLRQEGSRASTGKFSAMMRAASQDGRMRGLFQYYGAGRTGRWAGRRVQPQNMLRPIIAGELVEKAIHYALQGRGPDFFEVMFPGTPMAVIASCVRGCLVPGRGYVFVSVDLSQIEARIIAWLAGQNDVLAVFAAGNDAYVYAAAQVGSTNRQLGKVLVLACGFGMGPPRFQETAASYGVMLSAHDAEQNVYAWREANAKIVAFWYALGDAFKRVALSPSGTWERLGYLQIGKTGKAVRIRLPSGRDLVYQAVEILQDPTGRAEITYMGVHQLKRTWERLRTYGGKLAENVTQAVARDTMAEALLAAERASNDIRVVGSIHDEGLFEVLERVAQAGLASLLLIFRRVPRWAPGLPIGAEGWRGPRYRKG